MLLNHTRILRDVEHVDTSIELFGYSFSLPVFYAPIGSMQDFVKKWRIEFNIVCIR